MATLRGPANFLMPKGPISLNKHDISLAKITLWFITNYLTLIRIWTEHTPLRTVPMTYIYAKNKHKNNVLLLIIGKKFKRNRTRFVKDTKHCCMFRYIFIAKRRRKTPIIETNNTRIWLQLFHSYSHATWTIERTYFAC